MSSVASVVQPGMVIIDNMMSLIEYHDNLVFEVDIEAEESLEGLMVSSSSSATSAATQVTDRDARAAKINAARANLIKRITLAKEANCNAFPPPVAADQRNLFAPGGGMLVYVPKAVIKQLVPCRERARQVIGTIVLFDSNTHYLNTRFVDYLKSFIARSNELSDMREEYIRIPLDKVNKGFFFLKFYQFCLFLCDLDIYLTSFALSLSFSFICRRT